MLFLGAGEAATGIADLVVSAMMAEGLSEAEARRRNWLVDSRGLVVKDRAGLTEHKLRYAHDQAPIGDFLTAIDTLKPTAIIGVAAVGGAFTPEVLQTMAEINERPIVFALSNPTSKAECSAEEAYRHTGGRALFACGSPYRSGQARRQDFRAAPGQQLLHLPRRRSRRDRERRAAGDRRDVHGGRAHAGAISSTEADLAQGSLYPALPRIREVSAQIAEAVAEVAYKRGLATGPAAERPVGVHSIADVRSSILRRPGLRSRALLVRTDIFPRRGVGMIHREVIGRHG